MSQNQTEVDSRAFRFTKVDLDTGETTIVVKKEILGSLGRQLRETDNRRKGFSSLRKMGWMFGQFGDLQYDPDGFDIEDTDIDPFIITGDFRPSNPN